MSVHRLRSVHVLALFGAVLLTAGLAAPPPALAQSAFPSIRTDRNQYQVGDTIRVCYSVARPGPFTITDTQADGTSHIFFAGVDDGTGGCLSGTVTPPMGTECLRLTASGAFGGASQTCFRVGYQTPPPPGPCIQIYPPPPGCGGGGGSISTDQSQYAIGAPIRICYTVPGPGPFTITDIQADRSTHILLSAFDDGTGGCLGGMVTPPAGTECLRLDLLGVAGTGSTQTCFQVGGSVPLGCVAPVRTVTLSDNGGNITLGTRQCLLLSLGGGDNWTVAVDDGTVLSCEGGPLPPNTQGMCTALIPGSTTLRATGTPTCYPACLRPSLEFRLFVTVLP